MRLSSLLAGAWRDGAGPGQPLSDPTTGEVLAHASTEGLDLAEAVAYARTVGGPALQALTFAERGRLLQSVADALQAARADYDPIAAANSGNTKSDAAIDIDGAIGTLRFYARLGAKLGDAKRLREGGPIRFSKDEGFQAIHLLSPLRGVAIHVNAFNFPAWGLWGKAAVAILAGMPVVAKPATATALLAWRMTQDVVAAGALPPGALSLVCGPVGGLIDAAGMGDVIAFTGSAATAERLRLHPATIARGARLNVEADSLNAIVFGPDATPDGELFAQAVKETAREITQKAGQKCTAIRRVLVPAGHADAACAAIAAALAKTVVGDPRDPTVRMGPLVSKAQQADARDGMRRLADAGRIVCGGPDAVPDLVGADAERGCFVAPTLLRAEADAEPPHALEVFGPAATVIGWRDADAAAALLRRAEGALAATIATADPDFAHAMLDAGADRHGRMLLLEPSVAKTATGHGIAMPHCLHGGPGRAGGGEELGGWRGLRLYHQRTAVQGAGATVAALAAAAAPLDD